MEIVDLRLWDHPLAALFGLGLPAVSWLNSRRQMPSFSSSERVRLYWTNSLTLWLGAALVLAGWRWGGRSFDRLGLGPPEIAHPGWTLLLVGLIATGILLDSWLRVRSPERRAATRARWRRLTPFMPETGREFAHNASLAVSAGITEEIVFRGFLVHYVAALAGGGPVGWSLALALPALACGLSHGYQDGPAMVKITILSALLGGLFLLTGSLWIGMLLHAAIDLGMGLLGLWILNEEPQPASRQAAP